MHSIRALRPLATRQASRTLALRLNAHFAKRALNTDTAPVLYSAHSKVFGARNGHVEGDDLTTDLTMSKALGGPGDKGKTNPEELFAAGYGACFQSAMNLSALKMNIEMPQKEQDSIVETTVHLVGSMKDADLGIKVDMKVKIRGMELHNIEKVVEKAKQICPYSRATQGNVSTSVEIEQLV